MHNGCECIMDVNAYRQGLTANPAPEPPWRLPRVHAQAGALLQLYRSNIPTRVWKSENEASAPAPK
jgi:hypothetical protein